MQPSSRQACMLVIPPLVERHVGDAAFYWQQRERSAHSPLIDLPALAHFDRLLQAHLDGVGVAGGAGWALAMAELKRWRGAGEAFVCAVLALQRPDAPPSALDEVLAVVAQAPERMRAGVVGALRWAAHALAAARLAAWTHPDADPLRQTLAWQTLARSPELADTKLAARLATALAHPLMEVRAAACAAHTVLRKTPPHSLLDDAAPLVATEAAIALGTTGATRGAKTLWRHIEDALAHLPTRTGVEKTRAQRQLGRWVRHLARSVPPGFANVPELLAAMPVWLGLQFALHHASPACLPWLIRQMASAEHARLAAWIWQAITGIDLQAARLIGSAPAGWDEDASRSDDMSTGLPWPDVAALARHPVPTLPAGQTVLMGKALDTAHAAALLRSAPQALRWIAAHHLHGQGVAFDTLARARLQQHHLDTVH